MAHEARAFRAVARRLRRVSSVLAFAIGAAACTHEQRAVVAPRAQPEPPPRSPVRDAPLAPAEHSETFDTDTARTTETGVRYTVPAGWTLTTREHVAIVKAPEGDLELAIVEPQQRQPLDAVVAEAWQRYGIAPPTQVRSGEGVKSGGWDRIWWFNYQVPASAKRKLSADVRWHGDAPVVLLLDAASATLQKRASQFAVLDQSLQPEGYAHESFENKAAHALDAERLHRLDAFIEHGRVELGIPGVAIAITQAGKLVHARGYGVRELGKRTPIGSDTLFRIASITKPLTSLLLARLVDARALRWEQPVVEVYPDFRLGNLETTEAIRIEHLLCACAGLPRTDFPRFFGLGTASPERTMHELAETQPTTGFGEAFQYSNDLAAAAGFVAAHAVTPTQQLEKAYERIMQRWIFAPLGLNSTTFDYARALRTNHATGHTWSIASRGQTTVIDPDGLDRISTLAIAPAGGAWSNANDLIKYVEFELRRGIANNGKQLVSEYNLRMRQLPYAAIAPDVQYGLGLTVDRSYGTAIVGHSGRTFGYTSEVMWLPEHGVGAVFLANADAGDVLAEGFERYLLELLFDAEPSAQARVTERSAVLRKQLNDQLERITMPAEDRATTMLAAHYFSDRLGRLDVEHSAAGTDFRFRHWKSAVASRRYEDGTTSFTTIAPGFDIFEFTVSQAVDGKRQLTLREAQHEYIFTELP